MIFQRLFTEDIHLTFCDVVLLMCDVIQLSKYFIHLVNQAHFEIGMSIKHCLYI
jgi:hypothetical protein